MKSIAVAILFSYLIIGCQQKTSQETQSDTTAVATDTVVMMNSESESIDTPSQGFHGTSLDLDALDSTTQNLLKNLHEPGKLNSLVHPKYGCYLITDGPGVYPLVTEINASSTLVSNKQFAIFVNGLLPMNGYFVNPEGLDNCSSPEGIFIFDFKDSQFIYRTYQSQLSATDETMPEFKAEKIHALDAAFVKNAFFNLPSKDGETNTFDVYFARIEGKFYLAAIDTRGCGL